MERESLPGRRQNDDLPWRDSLKIMTSSDSKDVPNNQQRLPFKRHLYLNLHPPITRAVYLHKVGCIVCEADITSRLVVACQKYPVMPTELEADGTSAGLIIP